MRNRAVQGMVISVLMLILVALPIGSVSGQAGTIAQVGFFEDYDILPDRRIEVPVEIRDVENLYGIDIEITFDPAILQVEDADPNIPGVQPALGTFLDAGLTVFNEVDNEEGIVRFVMTQVNPAEPKSGDGIVLVLYFFSQAEGESDLTVSFVELAQRTGEGIEVEGVDGLLTVSSASEEKESTAIPVQDPTQIIVIPTQAPTPTPTITPTMNPTPTPAVETGPDTIVGADSGQAEMEQGESNISGQGDTEQAASGLSTRWTVLIGAAVLVMLLVIGMAVYLVKINKQ